MNVAIIVAAGRSTRMGGQVDKLWLEVAGRPVVAHAWRRFDECAAVDRIVLVGRPERRGDFEELARREALAKPWQWANGGPERQDSVWNGLQAAEGAEVVAIHDGARPCVTCALIEATLAAAREHGAAVAATPVSDTIKESLDGRTISRHLDRSRLWAVQTPQTFRREVIVRAMQEARQQGRVYTDDTGPCDLIGQKVFLVRSPAPNPKVTTPADLPVVEELLRQTGAR
ncbi:MAG: 2-C-methyl-D-erythritol 4-phosphate cytidylyltransferase [Verrucomicrobia bacterium]|nr:MAG: 2-C-methyl-D-erythritol 4-phosphate cytidylyltransferase [Verrucomicrobiota bacterium]